MSFVWGTMSKALEKSIDMVTVLCGGLSWLKPRATLCARGRRAEVVQWLERKPCCVGERGRVFSSGRRRRSKTFAAGHSREMGRYPDPKPADLPGLRIGTTTECFQMEGMSTVLYEWLKMWVRNEVPRGPRYLR